MSCRVRRRHGSFTCPSLVNCKEYGYDIGRGKSARLVVKVSAPRV